MSQASMSEIYFLPVPVHEQSLTRSSEKKQISLISAIAPSRLGNLLSNVNLAHAWSQMLPLESWISFCSRMEHLSGTIVINPFLRYNFEK
jgi:hypothetical protein